MSLESTALSPLLERPLTRVRLIWAAVLLILLVPMGIGWVTYIDLLHTVCETCPITPAFLAALGDLGVDLRVWIAWRLGHSMLIGTAWLGTGIIIFGLRSYDRRAVLMSVLLMLEGPGFGGLPYDLVLARPEWSIIFRVYSYLSIVGLLFLTTLFPNGRISPRWNLWPVIYLLIVLFPNSFLHGSRYDFSTWDASVNLPVVFGPLLLVLVGAPLYRYRKVFTPLERKQTRWAVLGFVIAAAGIFLTGYAASVWCGPDMNLGENSPGCSFVQGLGYGLSNLMIPVFIGVAILRSRLWDIDLIIRRTMIYAALSLLLGILYLGTVTVLQNLFTAATGQSSPLALVLSTLGIAALFNTLRHRIQGFIDRRFYRQKYNAEQALAGFSALARSETDLTELSRQMVGVVTHTLQPEQISLWVVTNKVPGRR
jgi:hypothetical protein